jgi:hypothetical protein
MARKRAARRPAPRPRPRQTLASKDRRFVGRDASPVLDRYPPKDPALNVRGPPSTAAIAAKPPASGSASPRPSAPPPSPAPAPLPLISLERPFDVDEFSSLLGETAVRVTVPREDLAEVLRRISEFMGFGIYVYSVSVRPSPGDLLKSFVVELQRVDYSAEKGVWVPFVEKGASDSPFGPSGTRT